MTTMHTEILCPELECIKELKILGLVGIMVPSVYKGVSYSSTEVRQRPLQLTSPYL